MLNIPQTQGQGLPTTFSSPLMLYTRKYQSLMFYFQSTFYLLLIELHFCFYFYFYFCFTFTFDATSMKVGRKWMDECAQKQFLILFFFLSIYISCSLVHSLFLTFYHSLSLSLTHTHTTILLMMTQCRIKIDSLCLLFLSYYSASFLVNFLLHSFVCLLLHLKNVLAPLHFFL